MKLKNTGAFFWKENNNLFFGIYAKTNHLIKKHPSAKLMGAWDPDTKGFIEKDHSPNKIWGVIFDQNGRDYVMSEDISFTDFEKAIDERGTMYDYADYTPDELYKELKKTRLHKRITKKWLTDTFEFIKNQLAGLA